MLSTLLALALSATLTWNDNSNNESGFIIYKANTAAESYVRLNTVGVNVKTFIDATANNGNCYKVSAYNAAGESTFSNVACISLPVAPSGAVVSSVK